MANAPGEKFRSRSDHRAYERAPVGCEPQKLLAPRSRALDNLDHLVRWTRGVANDLGDIRRAHFEPGAERRLDVLAGHPAIAAGLGMKEPEEGRLLPAELALAHRLLHLHAEPVVDGIEIAEHTFGKRVRPGAPRARPSIFTLFH